MNESAKCRSGRDAERVVGILPGGLGEKSACALGCTDPTHVRRAVNAHGVIESMQPHCLAKLRRVSVSPIGEYDGVWTTYGSRRLDHRRVTA
jgi:hypothetical protein